MLGKAQHTAQERNYGHKILTGEDLALEEITDTYSDAFDEYAPEVDWGDEAPGKAKDWGIIAAGVYHTKIAPIVQPAHVEEELSITLTGTGVTLLGYADVIEKDGTVRDTKVIAKRLPKGSEHTDLQLTAYSYALSRQLREPPKVVFDQVIKNKVPVVEPIESERTQDDYDSFEYIATKTIEAISAGVFPPNVDSFMCKPNQCGYWLTCPARKGLRIIAAQGLKEDE